MCVIIEKPADVLIDKRTVTDAYYSNMDGFGFMYAENGRVVADKFLPKSADEVWKVVNELQDKHLVLHFRITTHGKTEERQCHPFRVLSEESNGRDLLFMHNGVIQQHGNTHTDKPSDTIEFNREILRPMLRRNPDLLHSPPFQVMIEDYIVNSKLIFMDGDGVVTRMNDHLWEEHMGLWCSNLHFNYTYTKPKATYGWNGKAWTEGTAVSDNASKVTGNSAALGYWGDEVYEEDEADFSKGIRSDWDYSVDDLRTMTAYQIQDIMENQSWAIIDAVIDLIDEDSRMKGTG